MFQIPLNDGKFSIVDADDYEVLMQYKWICSAHNYAVHYKYIEKIGRRSKYRVTRMHRFIMNCPDDKEVDHINGNRLDNRRENLRVCLFNENSKNRLKQKAAATSIYKGVSWAKRHKKWWARIHHNGKSIDLGRYNTEEDAAIAYNDAALQYYGEFSGLNLIPTLRSA